MAQGVSALSNTRERWREIFVEQNPVRKLRALDGFLAEPRDAIELLQMLEQWRFDPDVFVRMAELLRKQAPLLPPQVCGALVEAIDRAWENHFEVGGRVDVAFEMAVVLHRAGQLSHAVRFYERSLEAGGAHATVCFNLALCRLDLGQRDAGRAMLDEVLRLAPDHAGAARVKATL
jgi:tetratricopeptide (TPR) repeat protein